MVQSGLAWLVPLGRRRADCGRRRNFVIIVLFDHFFGGFSADPLLIPGPLQAEIAAKNVEIFLFNYFSLQPGGAAVLN